MTTPIKWGGEILANTTKFSSQDQPALVALATGRFVAVWRDISESAGDTSGQAVRAQLFDTDGAKFGGEFVVNTWTTNDQYDPSVIALPDGRFMITWSTIGNGGGDTSQSAISAQYFDANGGRIGAEFMVNTTTALAQTSPAGSTFSTGRSLITWTDFSGVGDTVPGGIRAQLFAENGAKFGIEFQINSTTAGNQVTSSAAVLSNDRFVVAWADSSKTGTDTSGYAIRARLFDALGAPFAADFVVNTTTASDQFGAQVTALAGGKFVVSWTDSSQAAPDTSGIAVRAQVFGNDGSRVGSEFLVNTTTADDQFAPVMTALPDGRFVATWVSTIAGYGQVFAQVFNGDGTRSGTEFVASSGEFTYLNPPAVTTLPDGRFVVSYIKESDGSSTGIAAQIFDPRTGPVVLDGTAKADQLVGTQFADLIRGHDGGDWLYGHDGDDALVGGLGGDLLFGGAGRDTAVFSGAFADNDAIDYGQSILVGTMGAYDSLRGIEVLEFADGKIAVDDGNPLFDAIHYARHNGDVYHAAIGLKLHYDAVGWREGRDPNQLFDTSAYLAANRDVALSGINPLDHYAAVGWQEGRDPSAFFDTRLYLINNPDVAAANIDPLTHYLEFGYSEGRQAYEAVGSQIVNGFDAQYYLFRNPDVAAAGVDPYLHFNTVGWREGRDPNGWFQTSGYLTYYTDVAAADINPLTHYEVVGWTEGRDPSAYFDTHRYLVDNPDVAAANISPLDHFLRFGVYEGRQPYNDGVWN
jgi:hypothetical protein